MNKESSKSKRKKKNPRYSNTFRHFSQIRDAQSKEKSIRPGSTQKFGENPQASSTIPVLVTPRLCSLNNPRPCFRHSFLYFFHSKSYPLCPSAAIRIDLPTCEALSAYLTLSRKLKMQKLGCLLSFRILYSTYLLLDVGTI